MLHPCRRDRKNTGYRKEIADKGIGAFVLGKASYESRDYKGDYGSGGHVEDLIGNLPKRYSDYIENLLGRSNVTLVKYEEMVTDYHRWLEKFIIPFPLANKEQVIDELAAQSSVYFPTRTNDVMTHVKRITPGDHKNKLKPSTIKQLNEKFSDTLGVLGYEK